MFRIFAISFGAFLTVWTNAAAWEIQADERDPFDKSKHVFIAYEVANGQYLAVRCLSDGASLAAGITSGVFDRSADISLQLVADNKSPLSVSGGILGENGEKAAIQFGDAYTMEYLVGAKKFWLRLSGGTTRVTLSFTGGHPFDVVLRRAMTACGLLPADLTPEREAKPESSQKQGTNLTSDQQKCMDAWIKDASVRCPSLH